MPTLAPVPRARASEDDLACLVVLERLALRRAAPSSPLLARLDEEVRRLGQAATAEEAARAHEGFHARVAEAAGHRPLADLAEEVRAALAPVLRAALADAASAGAAARRQRAAVGALAAGDAPGAARLLRAEVESLLSPTARAAARRA
jgi:DNA-binding GntR family transcriptional regulator